MTPTSFDAARQHTIGDLLRRTAARSPQKIAIVCGGISWTYSEFDQICTRLAKALTARGVHAGDRVAVLSRNSHAFAAMRFALARTGAVLVPINFMLNAEEVGFILRSCGATMFLVGSRSEPLAAAALQKENSVRECIWLPGEEDGQNGPETMAHFEDLLTAEIPKVVLPSVDPRSVLQIIYTSGTESQPKGAMLTHEAVMWEYVSCIVEGEINAGDVMLHALPLYPPRNPCSRCGSSPSRFALAGAIAPPYCAWAA
ncbi:AMP-binding protein [Noviherbaspirillum pedocola]|uniref:AMP-binding protein n=1 Tax=Noviherbaspirillum pedocola TaxID=2801341 RepID=A0A934W9Q4_9BURK|nr:AMP-binding protein [Noviherbaspirillum pedocola]MBK4739285.1 AMP-binding protein [Noviherbaspirillum pedocola]